MTLTEIVVSQATDPFRIGLMVALVVTTFRQRASTGLVLPLVLGAAFFAILLPSVMGGLQSVPMVQAVVAGFAVNAVWIGIILGAWTVIERLRR